MEFTGERFMPGMEGQIELEHKHRYFLAREYARGKVVLDIASGEGYGTALISEVSEFVYGVDVSSEAINYSKIKYAGVKNIEFLEGSCAAIPLPDSSVDFVCSFETIEHHDQHHQMMAEIVRVLKPEGIFIISSPDKFVYSDSVKYENPFHVKELYKHEFEALISHYFENVVFHSQKVFYGSIVTGAEHDQFVYYKTGHDECDRTELDSAPYLIALASNGKLPVPYSGMLDNSSEYAESVEQLEGEVQRLMQIESELRLKLLENLPANLNKRRGLIRRFLRSLRKRCKKIW